MRGGGSAGSAVAAPVSFVPHSPQNLASTGIGAPHVGQPIARGSPHSMQNLRPASLTLPHCVQGNAHSRNRGRAGA